MKEEKPRRNGGTSLRWTARAIARVWSHSFSMFSAKKVATMRPAEVSLRPFCKRTKSKRSTVSSNFPI